MQKHLTDDQKAKMLNVLKKHNNTFDSKLGCYLHKKSHLELINGVQSDYIKPYGIPYWQEDLFKQ